MAATVTYLRQRHTNPWRCASSNHASSHQNEKDRQSRTYICMSRKKNFPFFCWRCLRLKVVSTCRCWWCSPAWISPRLMMTHVWTAGTRHMRKSSDTRIRSKIDVRSFGNPFFFLHGARSLAAARAFHKSFFYFFLFFLQLLMKAWQSNSILWMSIDLRRARSKSLHARSRSLYDLMKLFWLQKLCL